MNKINTEQWGVFRVGELFDIHPTKNYNKKNSELFEYPGDIPVVVNSSYNNGVGGYVDLEPTELGGIITFSDTTSATAIFYQKNPFVGYSHVQGMYPLDDIWTEKSMLFFLTVFKKAAYLLGFNYVNKFTRQLAKEMEVKLPVDEFGNIDISCMERQMDLYYLKNKKIIDDLNAIRTLKKNKIDIYRWKEFKIEDLFEVSRPSSRSQLNYEEGEIPFVASGNFNNGVLKRVSPNNEELDKGNCITISPVDGSAFYQKEDFLGRGGAGSSIIILRNQNLNEYNGLFIATVISKVCSKYSYNDMGNKDTIKKEIIKLPCIENEQPDWNYMENYIKIFPNKLTKK